MDDLDALLADLETTTSHLARRPVLLTDPPGGTSPTHPPSPHGGDPPRPPPPPYGPVPGGDTEQLYSTVQKARPPRPSPAPPGLGELDRLLRDLNATHSSIADEILAQFPPLKGPEGVKRKEAVDEDEVGVSPPRSSGTPPMSPASATSATQELDKLMASLSDFHLRRTPPPKKGVPEGGNLDSMLVLLQSDLSRQGVPTGAKGVCGSCQKPIAGKVVKALGCTWHPEHFVCARCGGELGGGSFFEKDGVPYCPRDYGRLFSPRCARCAQPILDKMVTALDKNWHPEHFCCVKCGQPFGEEGWWAPVSPHRVPSCPHRSPHVPPWPAVSLWPHPVLTCPCVPTSPHLHAGPTTIPAFPVSLRLTSPTIVSPCPHASLSLHRLPPPHRPHGVPQASWRRTASSTAARTSPSSSPAGAGAVGGPSWRATSPLWRGSGTPSASSAGSASRPSLGAASLRTAATPTVSGTSTPGGAHCAGAAGNPLLAAVSPPWPNASTPSTSSVPSASGPSPRAPSRSRRASPTASRASSVSSGEATAAPLSTTGGGPWCGVPQRSPMDAPQAPQEHSIGWGAPLRWSSRCSTLLGGLMHGDLAPLRCLMLWGAPQRSNGHPTTTTRTFQE